MAQSSGWWPGPQKLAALALKKQPGPHYQGHVQGPGAAGAAMQMGSDGALRQPGAGPSTHRKGRTQGSRGFWELCVDSCRVLGSPTPVLPAEATGPLLEVPGPCSIGDRGRRGWWPGWEHNDVPMPRRSRGSLGGVGIQCNQAETGCTLRTHRTTWKLSGPLVEQPCHQH